MLNRNNCKLYIFWNVSIFFVFRAHTCLSALIDLKNAFSFAIFVLKNHKFWNLQDYQSELICDPKKSLNYKDEWERKKGMIRAFSKPLMRRNHQVTFSSPAARLCDSVIWEKKIYIGTLLLSFSKKKKIKLLAITSEELVASQQHTDTHKDIHFPLISVDIDICWCRYSFAFSL